MAGGETFSLGEIAFPSVPEGAEGLRWAQATERKINTQIASRFRAKRPPIKDTHIITQKGGMVLHDRRHALIHYGQAPVIGFIPAQRATPQAMAGALWQMLQAFLSPGVGLQTVGSRFKREL